MLRKPGVGQSWAGEMTVIGEAVGTAPTQRRCPQHTPTSGCVVQDMFRISDGFSNGDLQWMGHDRLPRARRAGQCRLGM